jgi:glycosyltransferase involved in cell wall biosynthesis
MKIAILTSGRLPVPATKGGAVETKLDYILDYNANHHLLDITTYSIPPDERIDKNTKDNHYIYYSLTSRWSNVWRKIHNLFVDKLYYDDKIEFFLHRCISDIKKKSYDAIILANRPGYALSLQKYTKAKIILQINNDYLNIKTKKAEQIKEACSLIITCSDYLNRLASEVPCKREVPIITVHNGIDIKRFVEAKPIEKSRINLSDKDFVVFFSGRLTKEKGILELIQAIKKIKTIPHLKLIIAGASFYGKDTSVHPYLKELIKESEDIKDQVIFTGFIDYKEMPSFLKIANVIVVPSMWEEPFGLTVLEAMAAGVPLITTKSGGIPEVCEGAAILLNRDNIVKQLADAIIYLYKNPKEAKTLREKAQMRSWNFNKDIFSKKYLYTIQQIITNPQVK